MREVTTLRRLAAKLLPKKHRHAVHARIDAVLARVETPHLPIRSQTAAVAPGKPKTAALVYDRVWDGTMGRNVPAEIAFRGRTIFETNVMVASAIGPYVVREVTFEPKLEPMLALLREMTVGFKAGPAFSEQDVYHFATRALAENITTQHQMRVTPVFASVESRDLEYSAGDRAVITAALSALAVPDEESLTWQQVREIRQDPESRERLRRMHHWLDAEMIGKSWQFIEDEISIRVAEYERVVKKHGIKTALGCIAQTLDSRLLAAGSLSALAGASAGQPVWGVLGAAAFVVGKVTVNLTSAFLDLQDVRRTTHPEVAFVVETKRQARSSTA